MRGFESSIPVGFFTYPISQAADICAFRATTVPAGEDQKPMIEQATEIVRRFNHMYKTDLFPEPQAVYSKAKVLPGIDGRKMSKSYGNTIPFGASAEELWQQVRMMTTDPKRIKKTDPGDPDVCIVYQFHKVFNTEEANDIAVKCRAGEIGCVKCKKQLNEKMNKM